MSDDDSGILPSMSELNAFLHVAIRAALEAGRLQQAHVGGELRIDTKTSETDLVTHVDKLCETRIREIVAEAYPDHTVLGEEQGYGSATEGAADRDGSHRWIVDPIDGTLNFAHGFPFYCTSIGLEISGVPVVGVVYDSVRDELFTAVRGGGAFCNGRPLQVTRETVLKSAMLVTGFAYVEDRIVRNLDVFARMLPKTRSIRRAGAAALDLCYVAAGRVDGFWELGLQPWDVAAGTVILREAGGTLTGGDGSPYRLGQETMVASNGALHARLIDALDLTDIVLAQESAKSSVEV